VVNPAAIIIVFKFSYDLHSHPIFFEYWRSFAKINTRLANMEGVVHQEAMQQQANALRGGGVMRGDATTTIPMWQPAGMLMGGSASRGATRWHDGSAIAMGNGSNSAIDGGTAAQLWWAMVVAIGNSGYHNGRRQQQQHNCNWQQWWRCNGQCDNGTIVTAIALNGTGGDGRWQWRRHDCIGQQQQQRNGWQDANAMAMVMGGGGRKIAQWKTPMMVAQLQRATAMVAQWTARYNCGEQRHNCHEQRRQQWPMAARRWCKGSQWWQHNCNGW
jgi:hypothetical protein